ncbi:OTU domain-containing protein 5-A [Anthonomus grandis grandis]|uniref:OTU domain-containing protein 5-A n=1 Tax=Anthonomus grandis grandis TaxID=2921223 RepID=UPI0021654F3A|nr:OTU domain-containing protein 5-A [Anthonomus grandis grandis]XP_050314747.1 OTU domain-containing protein 5-A [Anthonomus grandis grandis]XP_050314748.1 OTU domain-containing protein 5-A [Anthonomus grandis grandis]
MTILPAIRNSTEENKETNPQNGSVDRSNRRSDISSIQIAENNTSARRSPFPLKERLRKRFKESNRSRDLEREREQKREIRREQKRDRIAVAKRDIGAEPLLDNTSDNVEQAVEPPCNNSLTKANELKEESTGFNSEDEYDENSFKNRLLSDEEWQKRDEFFYRCMSSLGWEIKQMNEDGACLFRSIADQIYGDQELHHQVRQDCMNYIVKNRDYFEPYVTEDFDKYVARKRTWYVHGNHLEIQAMSELYNRNIEVYCYQIEPINIFNCSSRLVNSYEPIRLSYHRMCHYNSISDPSKPSVGVGLGLPNYHPIDIDRRRVHDAVRASEQLLIEQTMLEDKLKATDWEATNEAIEEQVARESYIQYFRDTEKRLKQQGHPLASGSSSTITSASISSPRTTASRRGSVSPKGCQSPKASSSPKSTNVTPLASPRNTFGSTTETDTRDVVLPSYVPTKEEEAFAKRVYNSPRRISEQNDTDFSIGNFIAKEEAGSSSLFGSNLGGYEDFDQEIMAQVLAESQQMYLDELKIKSRKRNGSPEPSTSS